MSERSTQRQRIIEKIKSRGYWDVTIRPTRFVEEHLTLQHCRELVDESKVKLRGWYYPHISRRHPPQVGGVDYIESLIDWNGYIEIWRMYQSGQFTHLFGCREDWLNERTGILAVPQYADIEPGSVLGVIMALFSLTEIYEFASRLAEKDLFDRTAFMSITLHGMNNRGLKFFDERRTLFEDYICRINDLPREKTIEVTELLGKGREMALDDAIWILQRFNWMDVSRDMLREDQKKLFERRL